jgi:hypothetical protein
MSDDAAIQRTRVKLFIEGRLRGKVTVRSFHGLGMYIWSNQTLRGKADMSSPSLMEVDAENYFNRLVGIFQNTSGSSPERVAAAAKELYEYINVLAQEIDGAEYFMGTARPTEATDWGQTIRAIRSMIQELSTKMDKRDQDYLEMIIVVKDWMNKYGKVLDKSNEVLSKVNDEIESGKARVQSLGRKP